MCIRDRPYRSMKDSKLVDFMHSIEAMNREGYRFDYILQCDTDYAPCFTVARQRVVSHYPCCEQTRIIVPKTEIESWYLAGLTRSSCVLLGIPHVGVTDGLAKEDFNCLIPKRFESRIDFMAEVLRRYDTQEAKLNNSSFSYFVTRFLPRVLRGAT